MTSLLILAITGPLVGLLSSFFGIGGGVLIVPALYLAFPGIHPSMVISTSLGVIFANSIINLYYYSKKESDIQWNLIPFAFFCALIATFIGAKLTGILEPSLLKKIFAATLCIVIAKGIFYKNKKNKSEINSPRQLPMGVTNFLAGLVSSLTGLGGGVIVVPILLDAVKLQSKRVSLYSNMAMFCATGSALINFSLFSKVHPSTLELSYLNYKIGNIHLGMTIMIFIGGIFSAPLGVKLNSKCPDPLKKKIYLVLLTLVAIRIFFT